jgi:ketosteroid isomerase-like protein
MVKRISIEAFAQWMEAYGRASEKNDARASAALFAPDARYYETPFDEPLAGREAIHSYWKRGAQTLKDKETEYEVLAVKENRGFARWKAKFTSRDSGKRSLLDCVFVVAFNDQDLCTEFREWWHIKTLDEAV